MVAQISFGPAREIVFNRGSPSCHDVQPQREITALEQAFVDRDCIETRSGVMNARQAPARTLLKGCANVTFTIRLLGARRLNPADGILRSIDQDPRGSIRCITNDAAAGRIVRAGGNACQREHLRIDPARMPVDASQHDRMIGADTVEIRRGREYRRAKESLIPPDAVDPRAWSGLLHRVSDLRQDLLFRQPSQIQPFELLAEAGKVNMRIGEPWHADAWNIHAPSGRSSETLDLGDRPDSHDAPFRDSDCVGALV